MANTIPSAVDIAGSGSEDTIVSITLQATDPDSTPRFRLTSLPANGTLWLVPPIPGVDDGVPAQLGVSYMPDFSEGDDWFAFLSFVPAADWSGTTTFDFEAVDDSGENSAAATASITVEAAADAPVVDPNVHDRPEPRGDALKVTSTSTSEDSPQLIALEGGGFVGIWQQGLFPGQIIGRYFDAQGTPSPTAFPITPSGSPTEMLPVATAMPGGGFAVAWVNLNQSSFATDVSAKVYAPGAVEATAISIAATANIAEVNAAIAAVGDGFVVTWAVESGATSTILARRYTAAGVADGTVQTITSAADHGFGSGTGFNPPPHVITALSGGSYVVAWSEGGALLGRIVANNGAMGAPVPLAPNASGASLATLPDGAGFVVAYVDGEEFDADIYVQAFDASGAASGPAIQVCNTEFSAEFTPTIAVLPDGRYAVAWISNGGTEGSQDVFAAVLSPDGTLTNGGVIQVTSTGQTASFRPISEIQPTITALANGDFAVGWLQPFASGGQNHDVFVRVYRPGPGVLSGTEDQPLTLPSTVALSDTDGSEILAQLRIEGLPEGFSVSDGTHVVGSRAGGAWVVDAADAAAFLASLAAGTAQVTLIPAPDYFGAFQLAITAVSREVNAPVADGLETATSPTVLVNIVFAPSDDPARTNDDSASTSEDTAVSVAVLANDSADAPLAVAAVDGTAITVGAPVAVANGSVALNADGSLTFTPAEDFHGTSLFSYQAREALRYQFFDRDNATAFSTVAGIPTSGGVEGLAAGFDVAALAQRLSGNTDWFGIRYTGTIHVASGGSYTFYTTSDDGSALYVDGVMVVNNDFSHIPTERSGIVTLAVGPHAIEIRYFEGGGGEQLKVEVSGPDTAGAKTALLESTLLGTATANVAVNVAAVNDAPQFVNLAGARVATEQTAVLLAPDATVADVELDALNGGAGLYDDASLTVTRTGNGGAEDRYGFETSGALFTYGGGVVGTLASGGAHFATVLNAPGVLIITFDSAETPATTALVNDVLRRITFTNTSDTPPAQVELAFQLKDGGAVRLGAGAITSRIVTVEIAPIDDPTVMTDDSASTAEDTPVTIAVHGNDDDPDTPLAVRKIDGTAITVGGSVTTATGSVELAADGTLTFTPKANFHGTAAFDYTARAGLHFQLFDRTDSQSSFGSVAEIPTAGGVGGTATDFGVAALASSLTGSTDYFAVRYTGTINVAAGGSYTFHTRSDDGSALYVDGVMVVNNDFSQPPTERSGTVTLTAGSHAIEIRYFEGGGGEELQVSVAGPDTADVKTGLFDSSLLELSATVSVTVEPVNDAPVLTNLGGTVNAIEQTAVQLDSNVTVADAELDLLNGGAGLYTGAMLTVMRQGGANAEDRFGFFSTGSFDVVGDALTFTGLRFATFSQSGGVLSVEFDSAESPATRQLVTSVLRSVAYINTSDTPPGQIVLAWGFSDGNAAAPGGGTTTVNIAAAAEPTRLFDDDASTPEDTPVAIDLLGNDSDPDTPLAVTAINGAPISAGTAVAVANGSVMLDADGTLTFTPITGFNGQTSFSYQAGGTGLRYQLFDHTNFQTVADIPTSGGFSGFASNLDVNTLAVSHAGGTRSFGIRYTGALDVATAANYTFHIKSDDGSALYVDGVLVVGSDPSRPLTEQSNTVALAQGSHTIEIRYFQLFGTSSLQVDVSGPNIAGGRVALFDSVLAPQPVATVDVTVEAVNDAPQLVNLGYAVNALEQTGLIVNSGAYVIDSDLDALNGGNGLYTGASLTVAREGGASAADIFLLDAGSAPFTVDGSDLKSGGARFASFTNDGGTLTITFTSAETAATSALVADVMRHIVYRNDSDNPAAPVTLGYAFHDGSPGNGQGSGGQATATGTMTINVAPIDDATVIVADLARTAEDKPVVIDVLANDFDVDSLLTVTAIDDQPIATNGSVTVAHGDVMLNPDNTLTFMPAANFSGETSFTYRLSTGFGATVTVTVDPVEDPTIVGGDHDAVVAEGGTVTLGTADLTASDADVADVQLVYAVTGASHGVVLRNGVEADAFTQADLAAGLVAFQHDASEDDGSITLSLTGGGAAAQSVTMTIAVDPHGNDAPVAQEGVASGEEDTEIRGAVLALDIDNAPGELSYSLVGANGGALHGSVVMNADGSFVYTPDAEFSGTDSFAFRATDAEAESNAATMTVTVRPVKDTPSRGVEAAPIVYLENQGPVAVDPALVVTDPDSADLTRATVAIAGFVSGQDVLGFADQNGITGAYDATSGVLTLSGTSSLANYQAALRSVTYANTSDDPSATPRALEVRIDDGGGLVSLGGVGLTVAPVNDAPVNAMAGGYDVEANTSAALGRLAIADIDANAGTLTTTLSVAHGALMVAAAGAVVDGGGTDSVTISGTLAQINAALASVLYRADEDFFGDDTLTLVTHDGGNGGIGGALIDSDLATIRVNTWLILTPDDDRFTLLPGNSRVDARGGNDTITFDFRLVDAVVSYRGNTIIIDSATSHSVLTGFQRYVFTDGIVTTNDGNTLVDDLFYYARNHDVWNANVDAEDHYETFGWHEGRDPSAFFSTSIYLAIYPDVKAAGGNPLGHFGQIGWQEARLPSLAFDPLQYLAANPDVAAARVDPLAHFLRYGGDEGRQPFAPGELIAANGFDYVWYLQHNPDVAAAHLDPLQHFQTVGWREGRNPNALFDTAGYLAAYQDVADARINPLEHYDQFGWREGRDPSVGFDTSAYLATNPDVAAATVDPLTHFLRFGIHEGRSPHADGIWG